MMNTKQKEDIRVKFDQFRHFFRQKSQVKSSKSQSHDFVTCRASMSSNKYLGQSCNSNFQDIAVL